MIECPFLLEAGLQRTETPPDLKDKTAWKIKRDIKQLFEIETALGLQRSTGVRLSETFALSVSNGKLLKLSGATVSTWTAQCVHSIHSGPVKGNRT